MEKMGVPVYEYMWGPSEFTVTGTLKDYERAEKLKEIKVPVLFTCGQYDEATPDSTAYYQSMLPGSELAVFEDASHNHHLEKPVEYIRTVRAFLSRAER
jgi:proline-specific peptidase